MGQQIENNVERENQKNIVVHECFGVPAVRINDRCCNGNDVVLTWKA